MTVVEIITSVLVLGGSALALTAAIGVVRFPDTLSRMHAASKPQVLGLLLVLAGAAIRLSGHPDVGMIILAGIVVKNGIVLIDLVNRKRDEGYSRFDAILIGGRTRLRPILMTTATAVLGLLPIAIGMGAGGEMQRPMAITVIGGLTVSTLLTLLVIPVLYTLLDRSPDRVTDSALAGVAADGHRA